MPGPDDTVLQAVEVIRTLDQGTDINQSLKRPWAWSPTRGVPISVRPTAASAAGTMKLCTLWSLRSALRAGNVWVAHSRRYTNPETYLIPPAEWPRGA